MVRDYELRSLEGLGFDLRMTDWTLQHHASRLIKALYMSIAVSD
jgi:hypothetical protein